MRYFKSRLSPSLTCFRYCFTASLNAYGQGENGGWGQELSEACIFKNGSSLLLFGSFQTAVHFLQHIIVKIIRLVMGFKLTTS